ncbi:bifunctional tRNA (5-methylaminomethyl-2-thiouridine)(34)-methyltransferase MnmD/FAD-dependent 5-carboxymethylaminomethyl-2-thiouridine(34) oxidoreductase MnmC [Psychromonas sp.]|uniref:bifunctional tRNA (5-methylaminomethyl-2-thiouridine)(34)-methyltransferase MnmD/FAD-dependent 5-carboxymethylaminomethyl-2-thiouridine(34) oxidoreductase MnmC n=1 Tax=Psychromonas sp. TaxID=1884585 RepID=UPI0035646D5E
MSDAKYKLIKHAQIDWSDQLEPFSSQFNDVYFNTEQGIKEANYVFLDGNKLQQRWLNCTAEHFSIAETGFGSGLNFLLTCLHFTQFRKSNPSHPLKRLFFTSFEKYPLKKSDLITALQQWPQLNTYIAPLADLYPIALTGCHRILLSEFNITLDLWFGDVAETLPSLYVYDTGLFDCWYLDGFAPSKNPEMWAQRLFQLISSTCKENATFATFTAASVVRKGLISAGFDVHKRKGFGKKREMLTGQISAATFAKNAGKQYGQHYRPSAVQNPPDKKANVAIIGGGIASACLSLALIRRGYSVTVYCKDETLAGGASGNQQGALYPLLNEKHDALSQFFANAFLYSRNYIRQINQSQPFDYDFSGVLQLYYDSSAARKLDKILLAGLPKELVQQLSEMETDNIAGLSIGQKSLYYPLGGWLSPRQMVLAIFQQAKTEGQLSIHLNAELLSFSQSKQLPPSGTGAGWDLHFAEQTVQHSLLLLTTANNTLNFKQCEALPLSAARGQVTHIPSNEQLKQLQVTLCHEGYLTPLNNGKHCMGATFKRHELNQQFSQQEQVDNKNKLEKCITGQPWTEGIDIDHQDANVGIRCTTRDHFPYAGALPDYPATKLHYQDAAKVLNPANAPFHNNLYILTGLGSRGLCTAPLLAEMLVSQINKEPLPFAENILNSLQGNRQWINYLKKGKILKY